MMPLRSALALLACALLAAADGEANPWRSDLDAALREARTEGRTRPLAVLVSHPQCSWCHRMIAESGESAAVQRAAGEVVTVVLDAAERPDLAALIGVRSYPTLLLINRAGQEVRRVGGYLPPNDLATTLRVLALNGDTQKGGDSPLARRLDPHAMATTDEGRRQLVAMLGRGPAAMRAEIRTALVGAAEGRALLWPLLTDVSLAVRCDAAAILAGPLEDMRGYDPFAESAERERLAVAWRAAVEQAP